MPKECQLKSESQSQISPLLKQGGFMIKKTMMGNNTHPYPLPGGEPDLAPL